MGQISGGGRTSADSKLCTGDSHFDLVVLRFARSSDLSLFFSCQVKFAVVDTATVMIENERLADTIPRLRAIETATSNALNRAVSKDNYQRIPAGRGRGYAPAARVRPGSG
jgi:hypothetical protein